MEDRSYLHRYAILFGTYLGLFWVFKFVFFPLGLSQPTFLMMFFWGLTIAGPLMGYHLVKLYRDRVLGGRIGFIHAFTFSLFMYMYASLLVAVAHFVYFAFIDQGHVYNSYTQIISSLQVEDASGIEQYKEQLQIILDALAQLKPIEITVEMLTNNLFFGSILSMVTALILKKK